MPTDLEPRIHQTGQRLFALAEGSAPSVFQKKYWLDKVLEWCMQDEAFKVEMFRFIDVFPCLSRPESVARHLQEYFDRPGEGFAGVLQWGLKSVGSGSVAARVIAAGIGKNIRAMGAQFISGETPQTALPALERLRSDGMAFSVDLLGEAVMSETEADAYLQRYIEALDTLNAAQENWPALGGKAGAPDWGHAPRVNVSVKTSAMFSQMTPRAFAQSVDKARERLRPILEKAVAVGAFVHLDMEQRAFKDLILTVYRGLLEEPRFRGYPHVGITLQAYLRQTAGDVEDLIEWARRQRQPVFIRLVKGAYWDAEVIRARQSNWPLPVFARKPETDANFERLARRILENHDIVGLGCASHNIRTIACVMETARALNVPAGRLEYQMITGMAEPVQHALRQTGAPLRLYAPVGEMIQGMAYLVRRLLENTANDSFVRQSFTEQLPREELLRNPLEQIEPETENETVAAEASGDDTPPGPFANCPLLDWTVADKRTRFQEALAATRAGMPRGIPLHIGGEALPGSGKFDSTDPNDPGRVVGVVAAAGLSDAEKAVAVARKAFAHWADTDPATRAGYLFRAAAAARRMRFELAALQVYEVGKTWSEADADVCEAIDFLEYYGREMLRLAAPQPLGRVPGETSHLSYAPRGVGVVIAPWNFPLAISMGMVSAALVTGNTVVYKPASDAPVIGHMVHELFAAAGLPPGVLTFLPGPGGQIGDYLVSHPEVAFITFTGSREVGLRIVERAARTPEGARGVKRVVAEMGGKNAIIVDADADLDEAIVHVLQSAFGYQGQKCSACSRLIVLAENYDRLVGRLLAAAESLRLGNPEDPATYMGCVVSRSAREKIEAYIEIGKREGTLLLERPVPGDKGHRAPLAIFGDIRPEHRLAREEIFGPVLAILRVKDFDEALAVANGTPYALTGGVFSRSPANIAKARRSFRVGNLYINRGCTGAVVGRHPFGGFHMSGVGSKTGGPEYLQQFMVPRNVVENTMRRGFAPGEGV